MVHPKVVTVVAISATDTAAEPIQQELSSTVELTTRPGVSVGQCIEDTNPSWFVELLPITFST